MKTFNLIFTLLFLFVSFSNADVLGTKTQGPALIEGFNEIASAAGTTTLTKDSQTKQILTGTSTQTFVLPDATTIPLSRRFLIINKSTGTATIQTSGGGALTIISAGLQKEFHLRAAGSAAGTWDVLDGGGGGGAWGGITGTLSDQTDLQTALNAKAPTASPTFTGTIGTPLTASRALVTDSSGNLSASSTTSTALGYLDVSSSLTTLLAAKAPTASPTFTGTIGTPLTASKLLATDASGNLTATAANSSQAAYLDLTSSAQTQLNGKLSTSNYSAKGDLVAGVSSGVVAGLTVGSNGKVLTADSNATNGLRWDDPKVNKNYVTNGNAEGGVTTGWSTYADAAGTSPVDCTGGTPNSTWAASSSSAIHGSNNFLATLNTGATRQGEGVSYAFTTDSGDSPAMMSIRFYYKVAGGTFAAGNDADRTSTGDSDFTVWIYDVTNGVMIQPYTYRLYSNSTSVAEPFVSNFQTNSNSTSYRLCIHKGTSTSVSGTNITVRFDDFEISRSNIATNTPISDWKSYTPTFSNLGTVSSIFFRSRRVGDTLEVKGIFQTGTTSGAGAAAIFLGHGGVSGNVSIDTTKITNGSGLGTLTLGDSSTTLFAGSVVAPASGSYVNLGLQTSTTSSQIAILGSALASSTYYTVNFSVPITGWSSNSQVSDGYDGRQITATYRTSADVTIGTSNADVVWNTKIDDSTGMMNTSTGIVTVPSAGKYSFNLTGRLDTGGSAPGEVQVALIVTGKNAGTYVLYDFSALSASKIYPLTGSIDLEMNAGDTAKINAVSTTNSSTLKGGSSLYTAFSIKKLSSPQTMSATEVVSFVAEGASSSAIGSNTTIPFNTPTVDTHSGWNSTNKDWSAPYAGQYKVYCQIRITSGGATVNQYIDTLIQVDTVSKREFVKYVENTGVAGWEAGTSWQGNLNAGQKVRCVGDTNIGTPSLTTGATHTFMEIFRIK